MDFAEAQAVVLAALERAVKPSRKLHSESVAEVAEALCRRFDLDPEGGRLAGLAHDIAKDRPVSEQWSLASRAGEHRQTVAFSGLVESLRDTEFADKVIHGPAGAVYLCEAGVVDSLDVLGAVAFHSTARPGMSPLEKVVFAADKLEPRRKGAGPEEAAALRGLELEELFRYALGRSIAWLTAKGGSIAQTTLDLYNALGSAGSGT